MLIRLAFSFAVAASQVAAAQSVVASGSSPQLAVDARGTVRLIFGRGDTIMVVTSTDQGQQFSAPIIVGIVPNMHVGNTRGPVIASSSRRTIVAAVGKAGAIRLFELNHARNRWVAVQGSLNDVAGSAPEGLITITADDSDRFYAVWLDVRENRRNQIYLSTINPGTTKGRANVRVYAAPDGPVCECCRPSVAVAKGGVVAVMFRNSLAGYRDMYLTTSRDVSKTFAAAEKLGRGTWKFDACPMDGGAMAIESSGQIGSVWRRANTIYYARPGSPEVRIAEGRSPMMAVVGSETYVIWKGGTTIRMRTVRDATETVVGEGHAPQVKALGDGHMLAAWENGGSVYVRRF